MRVFARRALTLGLSVLLASGCGPSSEDGRVRPFGTDLLAWTDPRPFRPIVDLRADVNRNGTVDMDDPTEDENEDTWDANHGAIFLANIDDDRGGCAFSADPRTVGDDELAWCNDALDHVVMGSDDLEDLARLRIAPWPDAPDDAVGVISVPGRAGRRVHLFKKNITGFRFLDHDGDILMAEELRQGVELAIEARDIVRDPEVWDGFADVVLTVSRRGDVSTAVQDTVRLRVAPVVLFHPLEPSLVVYVSEMPSIDSRRFRQELGDTLRQEGGGATMTEFATDDPWAQDYFEPAYMSMPKAGGRQQIIQVNLRSANVFQPDSEVSPLRAAGRIVFWLRGPDQAALQQYELGMSWESQTLNSFGNTEVIPPYEKDGVKYPLGRLLRGNGPASRPDFQLDPSFKTLLEAQQVQPPVYLDTSWLAVAHVDETLSFVPAPTPRGWAVLVADPAGAVKMLRELEASGHGDAMLFRGLTWGYDRSAEVTVSEVLTNTNVMNATARAAVEVDAQLAQLREETGLTDEEILRVPFLFQELTNGVTAFQPGLVNLLSVSPSLVVAPEPHGPLIDGVDPFKKKLEDALEPFGIQVRWTDTWDLYHVGNGEVHCATHTARQVPDLKWWESGR